MTADQVFMLGVMLSLTSCAYSLRAIRARMGEKLSFWWF